MKLIFHIFHVHFLMRVEWKFLLKMIKSSKIYFMNLRHMISRDCLAQTFQNFQASVSLRFFSNKCNYCFNFQLPHVQTIIVIEEPWKGEVELLDAKYENMKTMYTWKNVFDSGKENRSIEPNAPMPEDTAILMYTSGSTGKMLP